MDSEERGFSYEYIGGRDKIGFGGDLYCGCEVGKYGKCSQCGFGEEKYRVGREFELGMKKLDDQGKVGGDYGKGLYDLGLGDGSGVKEQGNFIEVGYKVMGKYNGGYIMCVGGEEKSMINKVIIMINNNSEING